MLCNNKLDEAVILNQPVTIVHADPHTLRLESRDDANDNDNDIVILSVFKQPKKMVKNICAVC